MKNKQNNSFNKIIILVALIVGTSLILSNLIPNVLNKQNEQKKKEEISNCINKAEGIYFNNLKNYCLITGQNETECSHSKDFLKSIETGRENNKKKCYELDYNNLPSNLR